MIDASEVVGVLLLTLLVAFVAALLSLGLDRLLGLANRSGQRRGTPFLRTARYYLPMVRTIIWLLSAVIVLTLVLPRRNHWAALIIAFPVLLGAGLALRDYFADVLAGIRLAIERPFIRGDRLDFAGGSGTVLALGLTQTRILTDDGRERHIPNRRLVVEGYQATRRVELDVPVEVTLTIPPQAALTDAKEAAYRAAIVSRYASPTQSPSVFVESAGESLRLRVRAYVGGAGVLEAYRSELLEIWSEWTASAPN